MKQQHKGLLSCTLCTALGMGAVMPYRTSYLQQNWQWPATTTQAATLPGVCCSLATDSPLWPATEAIWPISRLLPPKALDWASNLTERLKPEA